MKLVVVLLLLLLSLLCTTTTSAQKADFAWGFGGSAYQIEGAWDKDGKGISTLDVFTHNKGGPNADVAADHYNRLESDLAYLGQLKATAYRFSISWPRILPNCTGQVNQKGIDFYNRMINEMLKQGAEPFLTMYHWDLPQACMDQFGGFTNEKIIDAFTQYADVLYANFGDRVRYWLTVNEPQAHCNFCYAIGRFGPGLSLGDKGRFTCMHYTHLIHGAVYNLAKTKYSSISGNWQFGLPSIIEWYYPDGSNPVLSADAGWFWGPCYFGDYPEDTKAFYKNELPAFTEEQKNMMRGSCTYLALNYYSGIGRPALVPSATSWQQTDPEGARRLAVWMYQKFKSDIIFTEIGYSAPDEEKMTREDIMTDKQGYRSLFWQYTISNVTAAATVDKVPVKGMLAWALLDNFEWFEYAQKFGCIGVDFTNGTLDRFVKPAATIMSKYFADFNNPFANGQAKPAGDATKTGTGGSTVTTGGGAAAATTSAKSGGLRVLDGSFGGVLLATLVVLSMF